MKNADSINGRWTVRLTLAGALAALLAGCQSVPQNDVLHGEDFVAEGEPRIFQSFADAHAAAGARADATLRAAHFDAGALNSLGQDKLDRMLRDDDVCEPLIVYLDVPEDDDFRMEREEDVTAYLRDAGLRDSQIRLLSGHNPRNETPVVLLSPPAGANAAAASAPAGSMSTTPVAPPGK